MDGWMRTRSVRMMGEVKGGATGLA
jgi:hypothetical protein